MAKMDTLFMPKAAEKPYPLIKMIKMILYGVYRLLTVSVRNSIAMIDITKLSSVSNETIVVTGTMRA